MREGRFPIARSGVIFKENFESAQWTTRNSGVITDGSFSNGILTCNGTSTKVVNKRIERSIKAVRLKVILNSTTEDVIKLSASHSITISGGTISANGFSAPTIYVDGEATTIVTTGEHEILVTTATAFTADTIIYGFVSSYFDGGFDLVELFNEDISAARASNLANNTQYAGLLLDGLVAYWDFTRQTAHDFSNNGYDLTLEGTTSYKKGSGLELNGTTDYAYRSVSNFRNNDSTGTIFAVCTPRELDNLDTIFGCGDETSKTRYIEFRTSDNKLSMTQGNNDGADAIEGNTVLETGKKYLFIVTSNGTAWKLYVNNIEQAITVTAGANTGDWFADIDLADNITIGVLKRTTVKLFFNGNVLNTGIYSRELTTEGIEQNYQYFRTQGMV